MNFLCIDVGTTGCKCQLFSHDGSILEYVFKEYDLKRIDGCNYVDVDGIWEHTFNMIRQVAKNYTVDSISISSFGESFVLLDKDDNVLCYPMLYTDPRGEDEAFEMIRCFGEEKCYQITGVIPHSMYSISKILWMKKHYPRLYEKADKVMLICDYLGYLLTGQRVIDYSLAARTGAFDVKKLQFSKEILNALDVDERLFSTAKRVGSIVGNILPEIKKALHIQNEPKLILGSHDQICTALGAGVLSVGDAVDGLGTVECITALFDGKEADVEMGRQGYPCVPYAIDGLYCTYILNYSSGSIINWMRKKIMHGYKGEENSFFEYIEKNITSAPSGILSLPYFSGAATPYQDSSAKGAIVNLTTETTDFMMYQSLLEGTAMEMRLNAEVVGRYALNIKNAVVTGGGANSDKWLQIKANIQNIPLKTLRSSEGGLCGLAMLSAVAMGTAETLVHAREIFVQYDEEYIPDAAAHQAYATQYEKYKKLYKTIKEMF